MDIAPQDLPGQSQRVNNNALITADRKLLHYFEVLRIFLKPLLARFGQIRILHVTCYYDGIIERRIPKNEAMDACLEALCKGVRSAKLRYMEELTLGVPYAGGHSSLFEDVDDKKCSVMLRRCGRSLRTASVKLFDHQNNYTTMPFF